MQNPKEPPGSFAKSTVTPYSEEEGLMAPTSCRFSIYYIINSNSWGLWQYGPLHTGSVPGSRRIECTSPCFLFDGTFSNSYPGNVSQYLCSKSCHRLQCS